MSQYPFSAALALALFWFSAASADDPPAAPTPTAAAAASDVPVEKLMAPAVLPDSVRGEATAPVTIIEYASMTCTHCAHFHEATWPQLKAKYIDTGKAKFILREFPLDPLATAAFMLARCLGPDKRDALTDTLFDKQKDWAFIDKPKEALMAIVAADGMSPAAFATCLQNDKLFNDVNAVRDAAAKSFGIDSTPTFFINGMRLTGALPIEDFDKALAPLLK